MAANAQDIADWERCKEKAHEMGITIKLRTDFEMTNRRGLMLGVLNTVPEVLAFLCGYEYSKESEDVSK
jgi:hypothetical protein